MIDDKVEPNKKRLWVPPVLIQETTDIVRGGKVDYLSEASVLGANGGAGSATLGLSS
jgi:hypothetical protein